MSPGPAAGLACAALGAALGPLLAELSRRLPHGWALRPAPAAPPARPAAPGSAPAASGPAGAVWPFSLAGALGCGLVGLRVGGGLRLGAHLFLVAVLVVVSAIDLRWRRIPDRVVFPALALTYAVIGLAGALDGLGPVRAALAGSAAYFVLLLVPALVYPVGMGLGDVKLALLLGAYLGWAAPGAWSAFGRVLAALLLASLLGTLVGAVLWLVRRRNEPFAFGPALALGAFAVLLAVPAG
ncbi:MAG: prepilin peptidase [Acidimicrobiales bacterium]